MDTIESLQAKMQQAERMMADVQKGLALLAEPADKQTDVDFAKLRHLGEQQAFHGHLLHQCSNAGEYLVLLLTVILARTNPQREEWLVLYRIAAGGGYERDVHDLLVDAMHMNDTRLLEAVKLIQRDKMENAFLCDSLLLYISGKRSQKTMRYLSDLYDMLGIGGEKLRHAINLMKEIADGHLDDYINSNEYFLRVIAEEMLSLVNESRKEAGLKELPLSEENMPIAMAHAKLLSEHYDEWKGNEIGEPYKGTRDENFGYASLDITTEEEYKAFMGVDVCKEAILREDATGCAFGYYRAKEHSYWIQAFFY